MLVGEVRCATTGLGWSWKLSGGSRLSSAPTKVSKNRQVCRAIKRSPIASSGARTLRFDGRGTRLLYTAKAGASAQSSMKGTPRAREDGCKYSTSAAAPSIREVPPTICR